MLTKGLESANVVKQERKQKKIDFIAENYDKFSNRQSLLKAIVEKFNCSKVLANRYTTQYERERGIECKRGRSISEGIRKRKERFDFIEENLMYKDPEIVNLLMSKFSIGRSASYQLLKQYKQNKADKFIELTGCVYENTKIKKNKIYIDDTDYFENSFNWKPKCVKRKPKGNGNFQ